MISQCIRIMVLNLAPINMKKTRITITHQLEKTQYYFMVVNPDKLTSSEVDKIKRLWELRWCLLMGGCINEKRDGRG
jgi:hypothetical protein